MTIQHARGGYAYLPGLRFASNGVIALPGMALERAVMPQLRSLPEGYGVLREHLERMGRPLYALCGIELRLPAALSLQVFRDFNEAYLAQLDRWSLLENDASPLARTNVAPFSHAPAGPSLAAFSYTTEADAARGAQDLVISGVAELAAGAAYPEDVIRRRETGLDALLEKARFVLDDVSDRITALGATWDESSSVHLYSTHPVVLEIGRELVARLDVAPLAGIVWHDAAPPVVDLELEVDVRRYAREVVVDV